MSPRAASAAALAASIAISVAGCGFDPATIPVPGAGIAGPTYRVEVHFADVLNLPAQAKVFADGARVGTVTDVRSADAAPGETTGYAVVELAVLERVRLPATTRAELRQQTVLGDIVVTLIPATDATDLAGGELRDGSTIPLERTRPAAQIEDTMAVLATFVDGGAIQRFQDVIEQLDGELPRDLARTEQIADTLAADIDDLATHLDDVDVFLDGSLGATEDLAVSAPLLADILTDGEVRQLVDAVSSLINALGLFGRIAEISRALTWLAPALEAGDAAARALVPLLFTARPFDLDAPSNLHLATGLLRDRIIPWVRYGPGVDLRSITVGDARMATEDQVDRVLDTLRMIGMVR